LTGREVIKKDNFEEEKSGERGGGNKQQGKRVVRGKKLIAHRITSRGGEKKHLYGEEDKYPRGGNSKLLGKSEKGEYYRLGVSNTKKRWCGP